MGNSTLPNYPSQSKEMTEDVLTQNDSSNDDFMRLEIPWIWSLELNFHWAISTGQTDNYDEHSKLFTFLKLWTQKFVTFKQKMDSKMAKCKIFTEKERHISEYTIWRKLQINDLNSCSHWVLEIHVNWKYIISRLFYTKKPILHCLTSATLAILKRKQSLYWSIIQANWLFSSEMKFFRKKLSKKPTNETNDLNKTDSILS